MKKLLFAILFFSSMFYAQLDYEKMQIKNTKLGDNLYRLYIGEGVSVLALLGDDGVLLVDAAYEQTSDKIISELRKLGNANIKYIVNTHWHEDHTGGNKKLGNLVDIISHDFVKQLRSSEQKLFGQIEKAYPDYAVPNITFNDQMTLSLNEENIKLKHLPGGHSGGDIIVYFSKSKVLCLGDLLFANYYPFVDLEHGGNAIKFVNHLDWIISNFPKDVKIVGGHGPIYTVKDLTNYSKDLKKSIDIIKKAKSDGLTVEKIVELKLLNELDGYGKWFITENWWIDTVLKSL